MPLIFKIIGGLTLLAFLISFFFFDIRFAYLEQFLTDNSVTSASFFIALMFFATVVAPFTVLPLVPVMAPLFGPFFTALYAIVGWWLGSMVAFLIARYGGKPILLRVGSLEKIAQYEEQVPPHLTFWSLVLLRMVVPVDILSYVVGFLSRITLLPYALATLIGIIPFAFLFSYGGVVFLQADYREFIVLGGIALFLFFSVLFFLRQHKKPTKLGIDDLADEDD